LEQNILYAEVRCSPANYTTQDRSPWQVLSDIKTAFDEAMRDTRKASGATECCHVNLIIIGTRQAGGDFRTAINRHLMLAVTAAEHWTNGNACRVVGVDLAGYEDVSTRAHYFRDDFKGVHRCGLALTVHAGENDAAEGIWSAVLDLNARRLGHALALSDSPDLMRTVADRAIAVEMCPLANLQIKGFPLDAAVATAPASKQYPLLDYLRAGVRVTVNTDNIGISAASLPDNLLLAARLCPGLTPLDILQLQRNALDAAFITPARQRDLLAGISLKLDRDRLSP
jgi:adenosine deaminase